MFFLIVFSVKSQNIDLLWTKNFTGTGNNQPIKMVSDVSGNIYIIGIFSGTVNQDALSLSATGANDIFIAKYSKIGQIIWLKQVGGTLGETPTSIALSNDGNYFYISGTTSSNPCVFDATNLATTGGSDIFIAKYAIDGTLQWAHNSGYSATNQFGGNISIDNSDNIVMTGMFLVDITFYGGVTTLTSPAPAVRQPFISKFDIDGNLTWAKMIVTDNSLTTFRNVSSDGTGYYFSGNYNGTLNFDVGAVTCIGTSDGFIFKTDFNGTGQWVRKVVGTSAEVIWRHHGDNTGYQYILGYYNSPTLSIDSTGVVSSLLTYPNAGNNDLILLKYAPDGTLQFAKNYGSNGDDQGNAISVNDDHVIIGGQYSGSINFGTFNLTNTGADAFMVETDLDGNVLSAKKATGANTEFTKTTRIASDNTNIFCGDFTSATIDIDGKTLTNASAGTRDMFIAKYGKITLDTIVTKANCDHTLDGAIDLTVSGDGTAPYTYLWSGPSGYTNNIEDISGLAVGAYSCTVTDANGATKTIAVNITNKPSLTGGMDDHYLIVPCSSSTNGETTMLYADGVAPFTFTWTAEAGVTASTSISNFADDLGVGKHYCTVNDFCGHPITDSVSVYYFPTLVISTAIIEDATCESVCDGELVMDISSGLPPYTIAWSGSPSTTSTASNLCTGWHYITVTDLCGDHVDSAYVDFNTPVTSETHFLSNVTCPAIEDGSAYAVVSDGTAPFSFFWSSAAAESNDTAVLLEFGWNYVTIVDACRTIIDSVYIPSDPLMTTDVMAATTATCAAINDGSATATTTGATAPVTYTWQAPSTSVTSSANDLQVGWNYVIIADACTSILDSVEIESDPLMTIDITSSTNATCAAINDGTASVSVFGSTAPITYAWSAPSISVANSANDLDVGWNYVTVTDACIALVDSVNILSNPLMTIDITSSDNATCAAINDGSASVSVFGSTAPVSYAWSLPSTSITNSANDLPVGWNYVTVTDACTSVVDSVDILSDPLMTTSITFSSGATCTGLQDGEATVTAFGATAPISYAWSLPSTSTAAYAGDLPTGWSYVTVTDACTSNRDSVNIGSDPLMTIDITSSNPATCAAINDGTAHVTLTGAVAPFTIAWSAPSTSTLEDATDLHVGWNYVTVTDACTAVVDSVNIASDPTISSDIASSTAATCIAINDGTASVVVYSATGTVTYLWGAPSISTLASATDLEVGWNYITITDACTAIVDSVDIPSAPATLATSIISSTVASCAGVNNGSAEVSASGTNGAVTYAWSAPSVSVAATAADLQVGWNYVTVTDICTFKVDSVDIGSAPLMTIDITDSLDASCAAVNNGYAVVLASGATAPITYVWSAPSVTLNDTAYDLAVGWNYVTVTDACTSLIDSVELFSLPLMTIDIIDSTDASCPGLANGSAEIAATGATAPITYLWEAPSTAVTAIAADLPIGWNYVTVTDACTSLVDSVEIFNLPLMTINIIDSTDATCAAINDGSAVIEVTDGAAPFTFVWSAPSVSTNDTATDLSVGINYVTVTDLCGSLIDSVDILSLPLMTINIIDSTSATCPAISDGSAVIEATGSTGALSYVWSAPSVSVNDTALDLSVGWNHVTVTDACISLVDSVEILSLPLMTISIIDSTNATCPTSTNGGAEVDTTGGVAPFTFVWSAPSTSVTTIANDLGVGMAYVTVTDACISLIDSVEILSLPVMNFEFTDSTYTSCAATFDGMATITVSDGVEPFVYDWSISASDTAVASGLNAGWHHVTVTDVCGSLTDSILIGTLPALGVMHLSTDIICYGDSTGAVNLSITDGVAPITYLWSVTDSIGSQLTGIPAGTYNYSVTDFCGTITNSVTIIEPGAISVTLLPENVTFTGMDDGAIDLIASGGTMPYSYLWSNGMTSEDLAMIVEGVYTITLTDENSCVFIDSVTIIAAGKYIEIMNVLTPNADGQNDTWMIKFIESYPDAIITVFNQWGQIVYNSTGYTDPWNGKKDNTGKELPAGTYYYIIDLQDNDMKYSGSVTILR